MSDINEDRAEAVARAIATKILGRAPTWHFIVEQIMPVVRAYGDQRERDASRAALFVDAPFFAAAEARGVARGREWCALMADVLGWKGRADERTSDYEQGARDMADRLSAHFRSAIDARLSAMERGE